MYSKGFDCSIVLHTAETEGEFLFHPFPLARCTMYMYHASKSLPEGQYLRIQIDRSKYSFRMNIPLKLFLLRGTLIFLCLFLGLRFDI